ncbi:MAG TPA: hypothetical protein VL137_05875 [Polyangiaceae bacterium]|nr:hypothetical protein [Polyangiaceae bacterium]
MKKSNSTLRSWPNYLVGGIVVLVAACGGGSNIDSACRPQSQSPALTLTSSRLFLTESLVSRLQARAVANDSAWTELAAQCDGYTTGTVNPPNGNAYPDGTNIGQGYQGDGYLAAIVALGLCYRTMKGVNDTAALKYAAAGSSVLAAMSTPANTGGAQPSTDSGYGIRNYGVGMALGYDWLKPELTTAVKQQVVTALNTWIDWYDQSGFSNNDSIANYFIGYFLAKTYTAIATEQDNPNATAYWSDVETRLWGQLVKPQYSAYMQGGGWPEGWQYGPRAVRGIAEGLWAVKTGKNLDWYSELPQGRQQAEYLNYFMWPSFDHMDDQGTVRSGYKLAPSTALYTSIATVLAELGDSEAPIAKAVAADVLAHSGADDREPWQKFLYWDPSHPMSSYTTRPLSYAATGPGHVAMRSSWESTASWAALSAGRYIDAPDSGEQMFNAGGLSVVIGAEPVIVNATGWIPQVANTAGEDFVYTDSWGGGGRRLYNTFFVDDPANSNAPGQNSASPEDSNARLEHFEDGGSYVRVRAANLEGQYGSSSSHPVTSYQRDLVYLRPGTFVLFDRTMVASASADRWMAFHTPVAPTAVVVQDVTQRRFDVSSNGVTTGSLRLLLPADPLVQNVSLPGGITRIEAHNGGGAAQEWLSVVTTGPVVPDQTRITSLTGNAAGVEVHAAREQIVLFPTDHAANSTLSAVDYTVAAGVAADHVVVDVQPSSMGYSVTVQPSDRGIAISISQGGNFQLSQEGVLAFTVTQTGTVVTMPANTPPATEPVTPSNTPPATVPPSPSSTPPSAAPADPSSPTTVPSSPSSAPSSAPPSTAPADPSSTPPASKPTKTSGAGGGTGVNNSVSSGGSRSTGTATSSYNDPALPPCD